MEPTPIIYKAKPYAPTHGYRARIRYPFDPDLGFAPKEKSFYGKTAAEADKALADFLLLERQQRGVAIVPAARQAIGEYAKAEYLPDLKARVSYKSYDTRERYLAKHFFADNVASIPLRVLEPSHLEAFFRKLQREKVSPDKRYTLKLDIGGVLKMARHYLPKPYGDYLLEVKVQLPQRKAPVFNPDDVLDAIYDENKPLEARILVAFLFIMRCRPSEMFALNKADISLRDDGTGTVTFDKSTTQEKDGWTITPGTKTGESDTVALTEPLTGLLRQWLGRPESLRSLLLFPTRTGGFYNPSSFRKQWTHVRSALGLPDLPFYALKATGITYCAEAGVSASVQKTATRHSTTRMIDSVYARHSTKAQLIAMEPFKRSKASA